MARRKASLPAFLHDLTSPTKGYRIVHDSDIAGLGVRIMASGQRSWVFSYSSHGRERRMTIGGYDAWTYEQARDEALRLRQLVDKGVDPLAEREKQRAEPVFNDLIEHWRGVDAPKNSVKTNASYEGLITNWLSPLLGAKTASELKRADLAHLHRMVSKHIAAQGRNKGKPTEALGNRSLALAHRILEVAINDELITGPNPARGIKLNVEIPRNPVVRTEQYKQVIDALDAPRYRHADKNAGAAIKLAAFTGARFGEIVGARWEQIDFQIGSWTKPADSTKQRRLHHVPLNTAALTLFANLYRDAEETAAKTGRPISAWVFPSTRRSRTGHIVNVKRLWTKAVQAAGLTDLRLHDLRHLFASHLVSSGITLPIVGNLLGHSTPAVTNRYAHVHLDPARAATERFSAFIGALGSGNAPAELVEHPRTRREGSG